MLYYMVVYPRGDRQRLIVAQVRSYEMSDWDLASKRQFDDEDECREYMQELAVKNGLFNSGILD
jgi:hypothetical protein